MIHYIKGVVTETMPGMVIIENGGIGYEVNVPDGSPAFLSSGEVITLYTAMMVREDDISLYGFSDKESLRLFYILLGVSGVGAKAALSILSALNPAELKRAIAFEDVNAITKANGVGKKIAQRVVLELKDKVDTTEIAYSGFDSHQFAPVGSARDEAITALIALGYSKSEAMSALVGITDETLTVEEFIKRALRNGR